MSLQNEAIIGEIRSLHQRGDYAAVIAAAERNPGVISSDAGAAFLVGLSHASTGALEKAQPFLARALALKRDFAVLSAAARVANLLGQKDEAARLIADLASDAAADPAAAHYLAEVYLQAGRAEEAFQLVEAALKSSGAPELFIMLAEAAIRTRRGAIGVAAARRADQRFGATRGVVKIAGPAALIGGDEAWLARVTAILERAPARDGAEIHDFWTSVLTAGGFRAEALRASEMAAARAPSAKRWRMTADLRLAATDLAGAEAAARAALALEPEDSAALSLLARCRLFAGDVADAKRLFIEAVTIDPDNAAAFDNLTRMDAAAMTPEMAARLERRVAEGALGADAQPKALLALARRDEAEGDYARAFSRVIEAKAMIARAAEAGGIGYSPEKTEAYLSRVKSLFPAAIETRSAPIAGPRLIFIVGMPRSGTSLVEQILSSHPDVCGGGELPGMIAMMNELAAADPAGAKARIAREGERLAGLYRAGLSSDALSSKAATDKHPLNFWSVGLIRALFPDARIVNLKRAPVDVCYSILRVRLFSDYDFANDIDAVAHYYAAYERMMAHWRGVHAESILDVDYGALVEGPEREIRALLDHCGLDWNDSCLDFHRTKRVVMTHSSAQVREPINKSALERREKYGDALQPIEDALARFRVQAR